MPETRDSITGAEVAVIGMAARFPGAKTIDEFWNNLKNGIESIGFFSNEELKERGVDAGLLENPAYVKTSGGLLEDKEYFDAAFFGYKPAEAEMIDPQVRIFLECAWQALENAGYDPDYKKMLIGLYAGASANFHWNARTLFSPARGTVDDFMVSLLTDKDQLVTWTSYHLNLKGPGVVVKSACSTSLLAIHMASQGILNGECDMALAGGITISSAQGRGYLYREGMINPPDGHCRAFDEKARGFSVGEGVGIVVLKALEDAVEHSDNIYAVIKGTAVNNDGNRKVGYTAPSVIGQAEAIRVAHQSADIDPESITYVETHGSGTIMGDPIEVEALKLAFNTDKKNYCAIGAVKTNIGHLDSAAGVAGFIKTVLALTHRLIPPSLHFENPNPKIDFSNSPFYVNTNPAEWKNDRYPLRAGVSSFGIGGTNAHVVLEEWPGQPSSHAKRTDQDAGENQVVEPVSRPYQLILLSAKTETALEELTRNLTGYLKQNPDINLADTAYTLQVGRKAFKHRRYLVCAAVDEAITALATGSKKVKTYFAREESESIPVIFMFAGQGSQYVNMGLDLYRTEPGFKKVVDHCFEILTPIMGFDLREILYPRAPDLKPAEDIEKINQTSITQPIVFVFEYALAMLLMGWGIKPYAMIGYSLGEYVAACVSGVLSLEEALRLVALRGKLMQQVPAGAMVSVPLKEEELLPLLNDELSLAIVNNPSCIVAGTNEAIRRFEEQLKQKRLLPIRINSFHAAHSLLMDSVIKEFAEEIKKVKLNKPQIPYISNVTGNWLTTGDALDPQYWINQLRGTVRFSDGLEELLKEDRAIFVEIGPGRVLGTFVRQNPGKKPGHTIINLIRHPDEKVSDDYLLLSELGQLWLYGKNIDWAGFYLGEKHRRVPLPTYPFQRQRFWIEGDPFKIGAELLAQYSLSGKKTDIADWFYIPSWKLSHCPSSRSRPPALPSNCLVFINGNPLANRLVERLRQGGIQVVAVKPGNTFTRQDDHTYTIDPTGKKDYDTLFKTLQEQGSKQIPPWILHLWNLTGDETNGQHPALDGINRALNLGLYSLIYLAQAIGRYNFKDNFQMTVIFDNLHDITGEKTLSPQKAPLLGPLEVIPKEYPNIHCQGIDVVVPGTGTVEEETLLEQLLKEMAVAAPDRMIALRSNHRWTRSFEPYRPGTPADDAPYLREKGVYLVTGGLGGIGLVLAQYLAKHQKARLILTGRSWFPPAPGRDQWLNSHDTHEPLSQKIRNIQELEKLGAEVLVQNADVTDLLHMQTVIDQAEKRFGPINGVIHSAGVPDYEGVIQRRGRQTIENILAAKVKGTLVLDAIFEEKDLDFFVLCSSLASIEAPFGQVGYTAANAFLDAFAAYKNFKGDSFFVSINWDTWKEVGFGVEAVKRMAENPDIVLKDAITPSEGQEVFRYALDAALPRLVVATRDLGLLLRKRNVQQTFNLNELPGEKISPPQLFRRPELSTDYVDPRNEFERTCAEIFQKYLGIEQVGVEDNFFELGASSLDMIHISNKLSELLAKEISPVIMFEYPTISFLAKFFHQEEAKQEDIAITTQRTGKINEGKDKLKLLKKKQKRVENV